MFTVTNSGLPTLKRAKCPHVPEEPGETHRDGTGGQFKCPRERLPPSLWVALMLGSICAEPLDQGRWWGQLQKHGQGTTFISSEKNFCP